MMKFEFDPDIVPNLKLVLHSFQIIFSFVAWCLEIAVLKNKDAKVTGRNGWTFGVVSSFREVLFVLFLANCMTFRCLSPCQLGSS